MTDNQRRILEMLAEKKISVDEAARLLDLVGQAGSAEAGVSEAAPVRKQRHKYLRVVVQPHTKGGPEADAKQVNIRVPMSLIHAGIKLSALIPSNAASQVNEALREKGIDMDLRNLKAEDVEQLVNALSDLEVNVQNGKDKVHIYVE